MNYPILHTLIFALFINTISAQQKNDLNSLQKKIITYYNIQLTELNTNRPYKSSHNPIKIATNSLLWVYQNIFSEQIMADCGFEPSCSSFASQAIKERNFFLGIFLTADRLTRCNGNEQIEGEAYLVNKKTGKLHDEPKMYKFSK